MGKTIVDQAGVGFVDEVHVAAVSRYDEPQPPSQSFRSRQVQAFSAGRKHDHVGLPVKREQFVFAEIGVDERDWCVPHRCLGSLRQDVFHLVVRIWKPLDHQPNRIG